MSAHSCDQVNPQNRKTRSKKRDGHDPEFFSHDLSGFDHQVFIRNLFRSDEIPAAIFIRRIFDHLVNHFNHIFDVDGL
ncbi:hypothetical protein D3C87_1932130 [compost metagenome]